MPLPTLTYPRPAQPWWASPWAPQRWWRELGRPTRGPGGVRVELVRTDEGALAIITDEAARRSA